MADALFVFACDIARDRTRRRVAERLERYGARVQESVFEIRASQRRAEALLASIDIELAAGDRVRMYAIPEDGRLRSRQLGGAPVGEAQEFWLL